MYYSIIASKDMQTPRQGYANYPTVFALKGLS